MLAPISGSRRDGKSSFRTLTRYLTESLDPETGKIMPRGEHVLSDSLLSYETAVPEMRSVAFENPRVADPIFHYQLCWRPGEQPSREKWEEAARKTIRDLGFSEHQFLVVSHNDREHFHVHVLINRVHPETYRAHTPLFSKRQEEKLRESERRFRAIFDHAFEAMGLLAPDGTVLEINRAGRLMTEGQSQLIGLPLWDLPWAGSDLEPDDSARQRLKGAIAQAARGERVRYTADLRRGEGDVRKIDISLTPVKDELGHVIYIVPEGRDVT